MTDILVYTEEQGNVIAGSVQPDRMTVAVLGAVGGGGGGGGGAVSSVNGQIGHVVLDAADVGADPAGTGASAAAAAVAAHVAAADPHPQYEHNLTAGANVIIDRTDPANPVISATGGGGGGSIVVSDEGTPTVNPVTTLNFTGFGVSVANAGGGVATITIPGGGAVDSVNGETGAVVLSATDVGADVAGTAVATVGAHVADTTPHDVITQVDRFGFDTAAGLTAGVGEMVWNAADGTADLGLPGGVTLQIGQEQLIRVLNKTGSTIQNMHVVYITGAQGNRVTAAQAQANSVNADKTLAVATQDIANNAEGFATLQGLVRGINTSAWAEGTELWLSAATPGAITNVRPAAPNHQVRVGYVVRSHTTEGVIYVTINIGSDLSHLHDVVITALADNDILIYDAATQTWQNGPQTGGAGEINTASNLGAGVGVFASKVGADLQFKSLVAGTGVTLTPTGTTITITASGGGGGAVDSVNGQTGVVVLDTDDVAEGVSNLYYTNARASAAAPVQSVNGQTGAVDLSGSYAPLSHVGSGGAAHANVVAGGAAGFMTGADKTKLDGIASGATANADTDTLAEGATNKYFTEGRVRSTLLTGLSLLTGGAIAAADSVLVALGKLQKQISDAVTAISGKQDTLVSGTNLKTVNGSSLLGSGDLSISGSGADWGDIGGTLADQADLQAALTARALVAGLPSRTITASGAVTPADAGKWLICTSETPVTLTIGAEATATWTTSGILPMFHVLQVGAGAVTVTGDGFSVTLHASDTNVLAGAGAAATAVWRASNAWSLIGRLVAA